MLSFFCLLGAWTLWQFLPSVHQLFKRKNADRFSDWWTRRGEYNIQIEFGKSAGSYRRGGPTGKTEVFPEIPDSKLHLLIPSRDTLRQSPIDCWARNRTLNTVKLTTPGNCSQPQLKTQAKCNLDKTEQWKMPKLTQN